VIVGVPLGLGRVLTTRSYYRSSYAFVWRRDRGLDLRSFDDPALRRLRIGVQLVGDDYANPPPAHALGRRGLAANVRGYTVYGDYARADPPADVLRAVTRGDVDVAVAWGPLAGYFATRLDAPLQIQPIPRDAALPWLPFSFDVGMGVRPGDETRRRRLDRFLERRRAAIDAILDRYGVPRVTAEGFER
jgi:ABC-type amino acid transport substrate-binding protein